MNGPINDKIVLDTNWIINFVKDNVDEKEFLGTARYISVITRIELYAFPKITQEEIEKITRLLKGVTVIPISDEVEQEAIEIRRKFRPKLPDAIIAATALALGATLVTGDGPLAKKKIPGLQTILTPSPPSNAKRMRHSRNKFLYVAVLGCFIVSTLVFAILFILK